MDQINYVQIDKMNIVSESYIDDTQVQISIRPDVDAKKPPSDYATIREKIDDNGNIIPNHYIVHANAHNKLGNIVLVATYNGVEYTKTVEIIPLW